mgnify:CR=1 FL=1
MKQIKLAKCLKSVIVFATLIGAFFCLFIAPAL